MKLILLAFRERLAFPVKITMIWYSQTLILQSFDILQSDSALRRILQMSLRTEMASGDKAYSLLINYIHLNEDWEKFNNLIAIQHKQRWIFLEIRILVTSTLC